MRGIQGRMRATNDCAFGISNIVQTMSRARGDIRCGRGWQFCQRLSIRFFCSFSRIGVLQTGTEFRVWPSLEIQDSTLEIQVSIFNLQNHTYREMSSFRGSNRLSRGSSRLGVVDCCFPPPCVQSHEGYQVIYKCRCMFTETCD